MYFRAMEETGRVPKLFKTIKRQTNIHILYDGVPFATGLPHYGHILAGTIKVIDMLVMLVELSLVGYCNKICSSKWISC